MAVSSALLTCHVSGIDDAVEVLSADIAKVQSSIAQAQALLMVR